MRRRSLMNILKGARNYTMKTLSRVIPRIRTSVNVRNRQNVKNPLLNVGDLLLS